MRVFLNGELLPGEEAKIPVLDRGFLFGDGVYEVIPVYNDRPFRLSEHLARLDNSLSAIDIRNPYSAAEWQGICSDIVRGNPGPADKVLYIQVTRGVGEREHLYNESMRPTVFVMCNPVSAKSYDQGVSAVTHADIRWQRCSIKAITLLPNILLRQLAREADGSYEAILIRDGFVTEGAASNVFIVKNSRVFTPPKDDNILPGITRDLLVELMNNAGLPVTETRFREEDLRDADEIWLTGSTTGVAPVIKLDGHPVGDGTPGKEWWTANRLFRDCIAEYKRR